MVRLVQAVGLLLALGVAADYVTSRGRDRDYEFRVFVKKDGSLGVEKKDHNPPYLLSAKYKTRFHFFNDTTEASTPIDVKLFEVDAQNMPITDPANCNVEFKKGKDCRSDVLPVEPTKRDHIWVETSKETGCELKKECKFIIQMKKRLATRFEDVDPDLRIERDGRLPDFIRWLLAAISALMLGAPIFRKFFAPSPPAAR